MEDKNFSIGGLIKKRDKKDEIPILLKEGFFINSQHVIKYKNRFMECINSFSSGWNSVLRDGIPKESVIPFVVFCPALDNLPSKCIRMGTFTTHNRGIGIRPAGERNYHLDNHVTHWKYIFPPKGD